MHTRSRSFTVFAATALIAGALLACKKKTPPTTDPGTGTGAGPTPTVTPTAPPTPSFDSSKLYKVGETAKAPDFTMAIENVKECKVPYYFKAKKGNIKLGVEVQIEGSADKDVPVNPFYAKVTDGDG